MPDGGAHSTRPGSEPTTFGMSDEESDYALSEDAALLAALLGADAWEVHGLDLTISGNIPLYLDVLTPEVLAEKSAIVSDVFEQEASPILPRDAVALVLALVWIRMRQDGLDMPAILEMGQAMVEAQDA